MNLKLAVMKLVVRAKRKKETWQNPVGERFSVPRSDKKPVDVLLYRPGNASRLLPVLFNIHGGGWVGCDASQMDSYCMDMAEKCGAFIVNINYTKLDIQPFPYPQEEIRDTVLYFRDHAAQYGIDPRRFALIGYSAGGHLAAASTLMLHDIGVDLSAQVLCYAFLDFTKGFAGELIDKKTAKLMDRFFFPKGVLPEAPYISPVMATDEQLTGIAPAVFVCCGPDPLTEHDKRYRARLEANGVPTSFKLYKKALHGFLEVNHPEYPAQEAKNPVQEGFAKDAEQYIAEQLKQIWNGGTLV